MKTPDIMHQQIVQLVEYAELVIRLQAAQDLLEPNGGYVSEHKLYEMIEAVKEETRKQMKIHMRNSGISKRVPILLNNMRYFIDCEDEEAERDKRDE